MSRRAEGISPTCKPSVFLSCSLTPRQAQGELFSSSAWNVQSLSQSRMFSPQGAAFPPLQQESASARRSWAAASCVQTKQLAGGLGEPPSCLGNSYITVLWHIGFLSLSSYYFSATYFFLHQKRLFPPHTSWERIRINGWWGRRRQQRNASGTLTGPGGVTLNPVPTACHICVNATVHQACIFFIFFCRKHFVFI